MLSPGFVSKPAMVQQCARQETPEWLELLSQQGLPNLE